MAYLSFENAFDLKELTGGDHATKTCKVENSTGINDRFCISERFKGKNNSRFEIGEGRFIEIDLDFVPCIKFIDQSL